MLLLNQVTLCKYYLQILKERLMNMPEDIIEKLITSYWQDNQSKQFLFDLEQQTTNILSIFDRVFVTDNETIIRNLVNELMHFSNTQSIKLSVNQLKSLVCTVIEKKLKVIETEAAASKLLSAVKIVFLTGCFDTKGNDYYYLYSYLIAAGTLPVAIDIGVFKNEFSSIFPVYMHITELSDGDEYNHIQREKNRPRAIQFINKIILDRFSNLYKQIKFDAILGLGGTNGTEMIANAMRDLPDKLPKVLVSTVAQHNNYHYTKTTGIILLNSIADVGGLNAISRTIYKQAVNCALGCLNLRLSLYLYQEVIQNKPCIAITMFGNTTKAAQICRENFEAEGYEVCIFHAVGTGGEALQELANKNYFVAVLDLTTTEIADAMYDGVFPAERKFYVNGERDKQIPWLVVPGCLEMINMDSLAKAEKQFPQHTVQKCNENVTVVHTNVLESAAIGVALAKKINYAQQQGTSIVVALPLRSLSMFDSQLEGGLKNWRDDCSRNLMLASIKKTLSPEIPVVVMDADINSKVFAEKISQVLLAMLTEKPINVKSVQDTVSNTASFFKMLPATVSFGACNIKCVAGQQRQRSLSF